MITSPDELTPKTLTDWFYKLGVLTAGTLTGVEFAANAAFNSRIVHLHLTYSPDAPIHAPRALLLKLNSDQWGKHEVIFYRLARDVTAIHAIIPACYASDYDDTSGHSLLLLHDYSDTHIAAITREQSIAGNGVPTPEQLERIIATIARFHAAWWEHPAMGSIPDLMEVRWWYRDEEFFRRHHAIRQEQVANFLEQFSAEVDANTITLIQELLAYYPGFWEFLAPRVTAYQNITLTQGDCYLTQFLVPRQPDDAPAIVVDFQSASANFGAYDLVYIMAAFWTPAQRAEYEEQLLRLYYESLSGYGVQGYSWNELREDYKVMVALMLFDPIQDAVRGSSASYWQPKLHCLAAACREWGW